MGLPQSSLAAGTAAMATAVLLSGCQFGFKVGNIESPGGVPGAPTAKPAVPRADVERVTADKWHSKSGGDPVAVSCPEDLPMEIGATVECVGTQGGVRYPVKITVKQANPPDDAKWDWQVGNPLGSA